MILVSETNRLGGLIFVITAALVLAGCGGSDGDRGPSGSDGGDGDTGLSCWDLNGNGIRDFPEEDTNGDGVIDVFDCRAPGAGQGLDLGSPEIVDLLVSIGKPIVAEISSAEASGPPVVQFSVSTSQGTPLVGLSPNAVSFTFVKLLPAVNGEPLRWQSYVNVFEEAREGTPSPNLLEKALQAARDSGGELMDNGDGTYAYTFATDVTNVTDPVAVIWQPGFSHRVGLEIRIDDAINPDNPTLDFVPDGGAGTGAKNIAATQTCNVCHERLEIHGGGRFTADYCVTCHNPGTRDQDYAELLDFAHMAHAIHGSGVRADQEESEGEFSYIVYGFGENFGAPPDDFSHVTYPQATNYCGNCHTGVGDDATEDGDRWNETVTAEACGACHVSSLIVSEPDENGLSTYQLSHAFGDFGNDQCLTCHIAGGVAGTTAELHAAGAPLTKVLGDMFVQTITDVTDAGPGLMPVVTYQYTDLDGNPLDVLNDPEFDNANGADLNMYFSWVTADFYNGDDLGNSNPGRGQNIRLRYDDVIAATSDNGDGTFTLTSPVALPLDFTGDIAVHLNGRLAVETLSGSGEYERALPDVAVFYPGVPKTEIVDNDKCNNCHEFLVFHGSRNNAQFCNTCHNADMASKSAPQSVSLQYLGHAIHAARGKWEDVTYPGRVSNCLGCHNDDTFYSARPEARAISTVVNVETLWNDDAATSTTSFACSTCHSGDVARAHMSQNGGLFDAAKTEPQLGQETCTICHGVGGIADVAEVHNVQEL